MSRKSPVYGPLVVMATLWMGCAKDEGPVFLPTPATPGEPIDTAYFAAEVLPIFEQKCWVCHPPMGGMDLGEAEAYANLVNVTSTSYAPALRIVPGDPTASVLWQKVTGSGEFGLTMPPNGTTLSFEELQTILDWIEQGAQEN